MEKKCAKHDRYSPLVNADRVDKQSNRKMEFCHVHYKSYQKKIEEGLTTHDKHP